MTQQQADLIKKYRMDPKDPYDDYYNPGDYAPVEDIVKLWQLNRKGTRQKGSYQKPIKMKVDVLYNYRQFERLGKDSNKFQSQIQSLKNSIARDGIQSNLILSIGKNGVTLLTQGNHRIQLCKQLGITQVPVMLNFANRVIKQSLSNNWYKISMQQEKIASGSDRKHSSGCLMANFNISKQQWKQVIGKINKKDLYTSQEGYGLEQNPHVTVLYGFDDDKLDIKKLQKDCKQKLKNSGKISISKVSLFEGGQKPYDVVKFQISGQRMPQLHDYFKQNYENQQTYPQYKPHMTIAYVKTGQGAKYIKQFTGKIELTLQSFEYSPSDGQHTIFKG